MELKDTEEVEEAKITKRVFYVSMEQVKVVNAASAQLPLGIGRQFIGLHLTLFFPQSDSFVSVALFHLHGWPKEGVPSSAQMMLELVEKSRLHWRETGFNLIAVHTATE